jgi:GntR family transcriptional regulator
MFIEIDPSLPQPLFEQVAAQIKFAIAAGTVRVNEMIPSVRQLAKQLAVNPNTVVRAFRMLQEEEILVPKRGVGLVVADDSQAECLKQRKEFFKERFNAFLAEAARSRLTADELNEIMTVTPAKAGG